MTSTDPTKGLTLTELSHRLGMPLTEVAKAAMTLGVSKTATEPLSDEDADALAKLLRLDRR